MCINTASIPVTLRLSAAAPAPPPAVELGLAGKAAVLPGDENMADVMQLLEAVERVAGGHGHRLLNESAEGMLRGGVAAARQGLQALQVQYQLLAPQGVSFSVSGAGMLVWCWWCWCMVVPMILHGLLRYAGQMVTGLCTFWVTGAGGGACCYNAA